MRILLISVFNLLVYTTSIGQMNDLGLQVPMPAVDQRVELLSIVARLAGYSEYNMGFNKKYVAEIHEYFDKYKDHPLIQFMRKVRVTNGTGYNAVMSMAVHLNPPPDLTPIITKNEPEDKQQVVDSPMFVSLLRQFYKDADFETFYHNHAAYYKTTESLFDTIFKQFDASWYYKYYGVAPKEKFVVLIGVGNGGGNYGPKLIRSDIDETAYAIIGEWLFDSLGNPVFDEKSNTLPTLIHEFNHSFVNYVDEEHRKELEKAGLVIFRAVADKMQRQAYNNWKTVFDEALVRASVIRYLMTHNADTAVAYRDSQIQLSNWFVWIDQLVDLLGIYESNRKTYPTLESFMPRIVEFYDSVSENIDTLKRNCDMAMAHVLSIAPFQNGDTTVNPAIKEIKITFDKSLSGQGSSIIPGRLGQAHDPVTKFIGYAENNMAIVIQVDLKPSFEYQFWLTGNSFQTAAGRPIENYKVSFKTAKE